MREIFFIFYFKIFKMTNAQSLICSFLLKTEKKLLRVRLKSKFEFLLFRTFLMIKTEGFISYTQLSPNKLLNTVFLMKWGYCDWIMQRMKYLNAAILS